MSEHRTSRARYPSHPAQVKTARQQAERAARLWSLGTATASALELVVSELVTNAVKHARTAPGRQVGVTLTLGEKSVRVEIRDADPAPPKFRHPSDDSEDGRGLLLVESLCQGWGVEHMVIGKAVWAELQLTEPVTCPEPGEGQ